MLVFGPIKSRVLCLDSNLFIGSLQPLYGDLGKLNALNTAYMTLAQQVEALQRQALLKFIAGSFAYQTDQVVLLEDQVAENPWAYFSSAPVMVDDASERAVPFSRAILRLISRSLNEAYVTLKLVSGSRSLLLRALEENYRYICIAVAYRTTFTTHGFHPPATCKASPVSASCRRVCSALTA